MRRTYAVRMRELKAQRKACIPQLGRTYRGTTLAEINARINALRASRGLKTKTCAGPIDSVTPAASD